ncbi:DUF917 family protein [Hypnocyclicus thermotrophus]|uniref:DUF917 family protein n=1 Tax=Hypnocyclicus thermotrophus TaxID=1627895 RepID=A0AA46DXC2_9FUSO|nr:DUF917 family protein [Hypnocyclicus thermotrophus]TDT67363.1 DUF917 family protein [Hypnocyclicus thermotrophus]
MKKINSKQDLEAIILGGLFLGAGGGGGKNEAIIIQNKILEYINQGKEINITTVNDNSLNSGAVVAMMGSPLALKKDNDYSAPSRAFNTLSKHMNENFNFTLPIEIGAVNSLIPILTAAQLDNLFVLDADGSRRAVPQLQLTTYSKDIKIAPAVLSNDNLNNYINSHLNITIDSEKINDLLSSDISDAEILESIARNILSSNIFECLCGISFYPFKKSELNKLADSTIQNTLSLIYKIGKNFIENNDRNLVQYIYNLFYNNKKELTTFFGGIKPIKIFKGEFVEYIPGSIDKKGFDFGTIIIKNENQEMHIFFENENLLSSLHETKKINKYKSTHKCNLWGMAPDTISYVTNEGPLSNVEVVNLSKGEKILVIGSKCDNKMRDPFISNGFYKVIYNLANHNKGGFIPKDLIPTKYIPIEKLE